MDERTRAALKDMLDHAREVVELVPPAQAHKRMADRLAKLGVERLLEIIGEAAARIPEAARAKIDLPWRKIVGLRNVLIHAYDRTDPDALAEVVRTEVPALVERLERALKRAD